MLPGLIAVFLYLAGAALWAQATMAGDVPPASVRMRLFVPAAVAIGIHATLLYQSLFLTAGLNLGFFNALSLVTWCAALLVTVGMFFRPIENLVLVFFPASSAGIVLDLLFTSERVIGAGVPLGVRVHIVLSIVAYAVLTIAAAQSLVLAVQERLLRHRHPVQALRLLPPLQIMEDLLIQILAAGFFLLSLSLATGFMFVSDLLSQHLAHKTVFSVLAWLIFALVLAGRWARGWRGTRLVSLTLGGFVLLLLAYFGSKFVLELILHRV
jgi:ABC-type uncharacterized transport system permease subunit